jgi:hypothetical protein
MGPITSYPSGTPHFLSLVSTMAAYTPDSHTRVGTVTFPTTAGNSTPIKSVGWVFGCTCWQLELDTEINKTNLQTLRFGFQLSWSRDNGPA